MLEILSASSEYDSIPVRAGEEGSLRLLAKNLGVKLGEKDRVNEPHVKTLILLYVTAPNRPCNCGYMFCMVFPGAF